MEKKIRQVATYISDDSCFSVVVSRCTADEGDNIVLDAEYMGLQSGTIVFDREEDLETLVKALADYIEARKEVKP